MNRLARLVHSPTLFAGCKSPASSHCVPGKSDLRWLVNCVSWFVLLAAVPSAFAQAQVGDELRMNASGLLMFCYSQKSANEIASTHGLTFGADGNLSGSYHDP